MTRVATRFLPYTLLLRDRLLVSLAEGDPNSVRTAGYLPGTSVRGAVAESIGAGASDFRDLVLSGRVRYLNAYPCRSAKPHSRAVPVPASWRGLRDTPGQVRDLAAGPGPSRKARGAPPARLVVPGADFFGIEADSTARGHHAQYRPRGRPTEDRGAMFTYEALARGMWLHGLIALSGPDIAAVEALAGRIRSILPSSGLRFGRSKTTEYGARAELRWGELQEREITTWSEVQQQPVTSGERLRLLLTADAVVRDPKSGQVDPAALDELVLSKLGGRAQPIDGYRALNVVSGFNRTWRLALPQTPAAGAGTVLLLEALQPIGLEDLMAIEHAGLGERRAEGFGACVFLKGPSLQEFPVLRDQGSKAPGPPKGQLPVVLVTAQRRLEDRAVELAVAHHAGELVRGSSSLPSPSLLGRLRVPLRRGPGGLNVLSEWLAGGLRPKALKQLEECRLGGTQHSPLDEWLKGVLTTGADDLARGGLFAGRAPQRFMFDERQSEEPARRDLARRAIPRLVDAVLAGLAKAGTGARGRGMSGPPGGPE